MATSIPHLRLGVKRGTFNCFFTPQNATAAESRHRAALIVRFTIEVENLQRGSILQGLVRTDLYGFAWLYNAIHITYIYIYIHYIHIAYSCIYIYIYIPVFSCTLYIYVYIYVHIYIYTHMCSLKTASFKRPVNLVSSW